MQCIRPAAALAAELELDLLERVGVEQIAQLVRACQLSQEVAIQRQRRNAPLGRGRVILVQVLRDVLEVERGGERRRRLRLDCDELTRAVPQSAEQLSQRDQVEMISQQLAVGLEQDRERAVALGDREQRLRAQPLLPERRALARPPARDQQRPRSALAEARAEQRRAAELADDEILDAVRIDRHELVRRERVGIGEVEDDAVVRPQRMRLDAVLLAQQRSQCESPGRMYARAEGREHAQAPVADLVAEALDDDRAVGGQDAGGRLLLPQVLHQRAGGALVAGVQPGQPLHGALVVQRRELALQPPDGAPELDGTPGLLALPEWHLCGLAGRGGDDHAIALDLLDAPRRGAQQEDLALARLVHHLLVELADAPAAVDEEHPVQTAVRDRARVRDGDPLGAFACAQRAGRALPDDARAQLGELVRRVAPGEQVEHVLELLARKLSIGIGAPDQLVQRVDLQLLDRGHGHDLLAQHVERDARHASVLDLALEHAAGDGGRLDELTAEAWVDAAARGHADAVAGAADPLQPACDRAGRGDLDDEIDGSHVDAELERRGGDDARQRARLEGLLDLAARLARERAVVSAGDRLLRKLVEAEREPLGHAAAVDEDDRRVVRPHELEQLRVERRPERVRPAVVRALHVLQRGGGLRLLWIGGHLDAEIELLAHARVDDPHLAVAADKARDLLQGPLRRRERHSLGVALAHVGEPLEGEREVRSALGGRDGVHLVDDHRLDAREELPRARREHQVQALGRRDEDVGRRPQHAPALVRRRVARAHGDAGRGEVDARGGRRRPDAREGRAQVALDVVVERLEGRDVEHAQALAGLRQHAVEEPQERRQGLARARRRAHEHVLARRDRRPAQGLSGRGRAERALEPAACVGREAGECVSGDGGHRRCTIRDVRAVVYRSRMSNESSPLAATTIAAASVTRAATMRLVARLGPIARGQQRAQRTGGQRDRGEDRGRVRVRGPDEQRRDSPDGDVERAARPQRKAGKHERGEPAHERAGARGHAERAGGDAERDRGDVQPPHGPTVVDAPSGTRRGCHLTAERPQPPRLADLPDQDDRKITWGRRRERSS